MNDFVSVVVPFYNAEPFLKKCIDSIVNQTYRNIELILVNNASTDNSYQVAEPFQADNRVQLITCNGKGVSYSRNMGLGYATGKWLLFVDADDYLETDMIENMMRIVTQNPEVIQCVETGYYDEASDGKIIACNQNEGVLKSFEKKEMLSELFGGSVGHYQGYLWNKLLLLDVIKENNITFDTDIYYNEDRLFLLKYFLATDENMIVRYFPKAYYHYIHHENSAMGKINQQPVSKAITEVKAFERMERLIKKNGKYTPVLNKLKVESLNSCFILLTTVSFKQAEDEKQMVRHYVKTHKVEGVKYQIKTFICMNNFLLMLFRRIKKKNRTGNQR